MVNLGAGVKLEVAGASGQRGQGKGTEGGKGKGAERARGREKT